MLDRAGDPQLRARGPARSGGAGAAWCGSLSRVLEPEQALIATAPAELEFVRVAADGRGVGAGRAVAAAGGRRGDRAAAGGAAAGRARRSGCCSRWSPTGRWSRSPSWRAVSGWRRTSRSPGLAADAVGEDPQPCIGRWTGCWRSRRSWPRQVYWATADLLNLEVDLLFFDTTSTYFERDEPDAETVDEDGCGAAGVPGVRALQGPPRPTCRRCVIGMAVTRTGIPIRAWCWPGNTADQPLIRQVKDELREWKLSPRGVGRRPRLPIG